MVRLLANCTQMVKKALFYWVYMFPFNQGVRSSSLRWSTKIYPKITKNKWFWGIFLSIYDEIRAFLRFFQKILLVCFGVFLFRLLANYSQILEQKKNRLFRLSFSYCAVPFEKISWHSALGEKLLDCIASATGYDSNGFSARLRYCENVCHAITSLRVVEVLVNCAAMSGRAFFRPAVSTLEEVTVL